LPSVASRTTRSAFWLLSKGLHLWALNSFVIQDSAMGSSDLNSAPQHSHTPIIGGGQVFTMRNDLLGINQVYRLGWSISRPVDFKRHHYRCTCVLSLCSHRVLH
jgi:hypothetical protein